MGQYNLKGEYYHKVNSGLRIFIKWLMSLVLLPTALIQSTFKAMHGKIKEKNCPKLLNLYKYYDKTWIGGKNWAISEICQWGNHIRTNNDAERFHMKLMSSIEKCNVPFYELINILGDIAITIPTTAKMFAQGLIISSQKKKTKSFELELTKASNELNNKQITPFQFLNILTETNHDNQLVNDSWGLAHSRIDTLPEIEISESDTEYDGALVNLK